MIKVTKQKMIQVMIIVKLAVVFAVTATAQDVKYYSNKGIAINGYDAVAYFIEGKAVAGNDIYTVDWSGSKWKFVSQNNMDSFTIAPKKYAPQYGGYCAYGCSENHKSPTDPTAWTIVGNKLYLNYNLKVREFWQKDTMARIQAADGFWPTLNN